MKTTPNLTALLLGLLAAPSAATNANACAGPDSEFHVTRRIPVKNIPPGTIQLQVDVPYDEEEIRSLDHGTLTLPVVKLISGSFQETSITFNFSTHTSCEYFGPTGKGLYVVLLPHRYAEGDAVLDELSRPVIDALLVPSERQPDFSYYIYPDFAALPAQMSCMRRAKSANVSDYDACFLKADPSGLFLNDSNDLHKGPSPLPSNPQPGMIKP